MAGADEHPRWCKSPGVERSMGKRAGRWWLREEEGRAQDLVCIPESDLAQGKKCPSNRQKRPPGNYVFISKVILRQLAIDSPPPPPYKVGPFLPCGCNPPCLPGTQVDAWFLGRSVWIFMV